MDLQTRLLSLLNAFNALDTRRKVAIAGGIAISLIAAIVINSVLNKPSTAPLYYNMSGEDLNAMSRLLAENNIEFVADPTQGTLSVAPELVASARMMLAEQGLPSSQESGYELFDRMNTIGLTSFMQDITNKRAVEGELVRTIQMIRGINSARVHIVLPEKNVYRSISGARPSASVVLKTHGKLADNSVYAIRNLVAAAVPGLAVDSVTIVDATGTLLTTAEISGSSKLVEMERNFEQEAQTKIITALGAHLGLENFRITVMAKLNSDARKIQEMIYDPETRVEKSSQVVREAGSSQNKETSAPTTIEQTIPEENLQAGPGQSSLENNERREENTEYLISNKQLQVVSDGYTIEKLAVALVVNRARVLEVLGDNPSQQEIDAKVAELETIVRSALSFSDQRGDTLKVSLMEFVEKEGSTGENSEFSVTDLLRMHTGALVNATGLIVASLLFALLGVRPLLAFLNRGAARNSGTPQAQAQLPKGNAAGERADSEPNIAALPGGSDPMLQDRSERRAGSAGQRDVENIANQERQIRERIEDYLSEGEQRAALALRMWLKDAAVVPAEEQKAS